MAFRTTRTTASPVVLADHRHFQLRRDRSPLPVATLELQLGYFLPHELLGHGHMRHGPRAHDDAHLLAEGFGGQDLEGHGVALEAQLRHGSVARLGGQLHVSQERLNLLDHHGAPASHTAQADVRHDQRLGLRHGLSAARDDAQPVAVVLHVVPQGDFRASRPHDRPDGGVVVHGQQRHQRQRDLHGHGVLHLSHRAATEQVRQPIWDASAGRGRRRGYRPGHRHRKGLADSGRGGRRHVRHRRRSRSPAIRLVVGSASVSVPVALPVALPVAVAAAAAVGGPPVPISVLRGRATGPAVAVLVASNHQCPLRNAHASANETREGGIP
mmetsp:Transcript_2510/g.9716  ORF Transcript_2510/g.9716 Transcript_2510/m.9716 type:complete len:327 (+) Transcript_2510:231-1211(+)